MLMFNWQCKLRRRTARKCGVPGVMETIDFKSVIAEERVRTERTRIGFSLLAFRSNDTDQAAATMHNLQVAAKERLRILDKIGWLDRDTLGVLMPITTTNDAIQVAEEICRKLKQKGKPAPEYEVFAFPLTQTHPPEEQGSSDTNDSSLEAIVLEECKKLQQELDATTSSANDHSSASTEDTSAFRSTAPTRAVHSMSQLFVHPMPYWKRLLDIVGASFGLILTSPILLTSMLAIKLTSPGPAVFSQYRTGLGGRRFKIYKLRSMVTDAEERKRELMELNEQDGPAFKIASDPRVTPVGRFLRATSIDELPQLWNVLKGDMSLVGPRPLPCNETDSCHGWLRRRLDVTPGLTCAWQTQPQRNQISFDDWTRMDVRYIQERSVWTDFKHVWHTIGVVLGRRSV